MAKTAAVIVIGNEILSGKVGDTNSHFLASQLRELGVDVRRIVVVPDEVDVIADEVSSASSRFDFVFTTGGVGPTHDDVTMSGIAKGFGLRTVTNPIIEGFLRDRCGNDITGSLLKMAELPEGAEVIEVEGMRFPPVVINNVYVFPGIPEYLVRKFTAIRDRFRSKPYRLKSVYVNEEECFIADHLTSVTEKFPEVMVGSYPKVDEPQYKVIVTLESTDEGTLEKALGTLLGLLPEKVVVRVE